MERLHYEVFKGGVNRRLDFAGGRVRGRSSISVLCFNESGRVVGSLECYYIGCGKFRTHHASGTFVDGAYQGHGIATCLWRLAFEYTKPKIVNVQVISDRGMTLAKSLSEKFPQYTWKIWQSCGRPLRRLRKKRGKKGTGNPSDRLFYHPGY